MCRMAKSSVNGLEPLNVFTVFSISDINSAPEEDNEIYAGAQALSDMGDKDTTARLKKLKDTAKAKKPVINAAITRLSDSLSKAI